MFADAFLPDGRPPKPEAFRFPAHAAVLEQIAKTKGEAFYRGGLAEKTRGACQAARRRDARHRLRRAQVRWVEPLAMDYRGYTLHEIPPNGQGIVALMALGMPEHFDLRSHPVDGVDSVHLQIEAIKLVPARMALRRDIDYMKEVRPSGLIDASISRSAQADRSQARAGVRRGQAAARAARSI